MKTDLYPLKFSPIFKDKIWGGNKLKTYLGKAIPSDTTGESWEICDVNEDVSVIACGALKGKTLREVISSYKAQLVGKKVYEQFGNTFPLLIKFIDAKETLSVQLHPGDELARKRHDSFGKTEMWYVVQADKDCGIIVGFNKGVTKEKYLTHLEHKTLRKLLNFEKVVPGDTFFIKPGLIHAIGEGVLLAEIQQTSDITYRVYDWDRKDTDGNFRELHNDLAIDAIDFTPNNTYKVQYTAEENKSTDLVKNQYYTTNVLTLSTRKKIDYSSIDSFVIYMCIEGEALLETSGCNPIQLTMGETILIPACINEVTLTSEKATLLEVTV